MELGVSTPSTRCRGCRKALVFLTVKARNDRIACHKRRQGATVEIVGQDPQIFRIGTDVSLCKGDPSRLQEALGFGARGAAGFRVEMNLHWQASPIAVRDFLYQK
jgi:hypothetical protein